MVTIQLSLNPHKNKMKAKESIDKRNKPVLDCKETYNKKKYAEKYINIEKILFAKS